MVWVEHSTVSVRLFKSILGLDDGTDTPQMAFNAGCFSNFQLCLEHDEQHVDHVVTIEIQVVIKLGHVVSHSQRHKSLKIP